MTGAPPKAGRPIDAVAGVLAFLVFFAGFYGLLLSPANWRFGAYGVAAIACAVIAFMVRKSQPKIAWACVLIPALVIAAIALAPDFMLGVRTP